MPGTIDLIKEAYSLFRSRLKSLLLVSLLPTTFIILASLVIGLLVVVGILTRSLILIIPGLAIVIALSISISLGQLALLFAISSPEPLSVKSALSSAWKKLLSYWWLAFISGLAIFGGYLFFILPGIIFSVWFALSTYVFATEGLSGISALTKSRAYVRGHWWEVAGRIIIGSLVIFLPQILVSIIFGSPDNKSIASFINFIISLFTTPMASCYMFSMYQHLKKLNPTAGSIPSTKFKISIIISMILGGFIIPLTIISTLLLITINQQFKTTKTTLPIPATNSATFR